MSYLGDRDFSVFECEIENCLKLNYLSHLKHKKHNPGLESKQKLELGLSVWSSRSLAGSKFSVHV